MKSLAAQIIAVLLLFSFFMPCTLLAESPKSHVKKGEAYYELARFSEAVAEFDLALAADINYQKAWYARGKAYFEQKKYREAIADYSRAIELRKDCARAFYHRGKAYAALKDYRQALADYDRAIEIRSVTTRHGMPEVW